MLQPGRRPLFLLACALLLTGCSAERQKARHSARADEYLRAGQYDKAKIEYLALLRLSPDRSNVTALQQLGHIWLEEGSPLQALPYLLKARELAPENLGVRIELARVFAFVGANDSAQKEAAAVLREQPGQEEALLVLVDTARSEPEISGAEQELRRIPEGNDLTYHLGWAALAARQGDLVYARNELGEAIKVAPNSARAHLSLAELYALQEDWREAREEFRTAAELSPARSSARLKYAELERRGGETEEATRVLREVIRQAPDYLPAWCLLADIALTEGKFDEALSLLENVLSRDSSNREALILQARSWLGRGERKEAIAGLERLADVYPNVSLIKYHLARAYLADSNLEAATNAVNDVLADEADYPEAVLLSAQLNLRKGNPLVAVAALLKLLRAHPGLVAAQALLVDAYTAAGRLGEAAAAIRSQIANATQPSAETYIRLGLILRQEKKTDEAIDAFEHALDLAPDSLQPIEQLIDLDLLQKNTERARRRLQQRFAKEPNSPGAHYLDGKIYAAEGKWDEAETALHAALKLNPNFSGAFDLLISTYVSAHQLDQASDELQVFLSKNPDNLRELTNFARISTMMKQYPKARDTYEKLLSVNPESAEALNNLAYLYAEHFGQLEKAIQLGRKARVLEPHDPSIADTLGWTLYRSGDYGEALPLLRESAGKSSADRDVQLHFGMASYMMGELETALKALRAAVPAEVDVGDKAEAQRRLAFLEKRSRQNLSVNDLETAAREHPEDVVAGICLGDAYEQQGAFAKAATAYEQAFAVNPELVVAAKKLAELNAGPLQNENMAFAFAKKARDLAPNDPKIAAILGQLAYRLGNFSWAYSLLQEGIRKLSSDAKVLHDFSWCAYSLGKVDEARRIMQDALNAHPDVVLGHDARSFLEMTDLVSDPAKLIHAEPQIRKILAEDPFYVPALVAKAELLVRGGDSKAGAAIYRDVVQHYPDFAPAQKRLAALYLDDPSRTDEAFQIALKARNALPADPELASILGELSYRRKDFQYAIQCFQEGARTHRLRGRDLYYLGMSQLQMSQDSESRNTLQQALSAGLEEPMSGEAKATMVELKKRAGL